MQVYLPFLLLPVVDRCTPDELVVAPSLAGFKLLIILLAAEVLLLLVILLVVIIVDVASLGEKSPLVIAR